MKNLGDGRPRSALDKTRRMCRRVAMFDQLSILAPGLLGGSVARAAHERRLARRIVLWARRPETRAELRGQPWCDEVADSAEKAVEHASLVVLAPPVDRIPELAARIASHLPPGALVTDVGSTKARIATLCHAALRADTPFVPSHPMAGSDKTGWENASSALFERRVCFVTPLGDTPADALERVSAFWSALGMSVIVTDPTRHDEIVAHISHLPQVVASTLCAFLASKDPSWRGYAGGGLRDTTRIAGGDPAMWRAILEHNRDAILGALTQYQDELRTFTDSLERRDYDDLAARLQRGRAYRSGL
ncbi:prephenate dehydrogenase [mine drainage metagenome]|uniref:Prephenate dehydrogenase n=1 Tax=mine drainage metagenome TaxID=410659 RepID=A0A1J5TRN8_9ZZZZ